MNKAQLYVTECEAHNLRVTAIHPGILHPARYQAIDSKIAMVMVPRLGRWSLISPSASTPAPAFAPPRLVGGHLSGGLVSNVYAYCISTCTRKTAPHMG